MPAPVELLKKIPLFSDLEGRDLQTLAQSFKERTFEPGHTIASEGTSGIGFFVIGEGEAAVTVQGQERATLGPGQYFGEIALIDEGSRTATVVAKTDLTCYGLTAWEFRPLVESNGVIAWKLLQTLVRRMRESDQRES